MDQLISSPGILMKPDLREDPDQHAKLQDIVDILVAAGYFRARIKTLAPFDKIIGGMAWAIQVSSQDLDIDLFFQDSLDIGHKIALTEKIVHSLLVMNCPHRIEPHQIQGLDCIHILPVIQWLVRTSIEVMQQHAAFNKLIAARKFKLLSNKPIEYESIFDYRKKQHECIANDRIEKLKTILEDLDSRIQTLETELKDFDDIDERKRLVEKFLLVKKNKDAFKQECRLEKEKYQAIIHKLQGVKQSQIEAADDKCDLQLVLNEKTNELEDTEVQVLATNQKILNLKKKLDSIPSKSEVNQYQKRFVELYQSIALRNNDIKKYYIFYNSLTDTRLYIKKEINLLDSIFENLSTAKHSATSKDDFLLQFQHIVDGIIRARVNVYDKLKIEESRRNKLNDEYSKLIEQQRLYTKLLKEFKEECQLNEKLA